MKENFVTIFNSLYLPQGIALNKSLLKFVKNYNLWVICADDLSYEILNKLNLQNIKLINLKNYETEELLNLKKQRTISEYLWTLSPILPKIIFESDFSIDRVTYLDADMYILDSLNSIYEEFEKSNKAVLITKHGYNPEYDQSFLSGKFCVQFIIYKRNDSEIIRKWWEEKCLNWCFARFEDNKFGDQKYLDDFPLLFKDKVHILSSDSSFLAPWNAQIYTYSNALAFHFHGFRIIKENKYIFSKYPIPRPVINYIYLPYVDEINFGLTLLKNHGYSIQSQSNDYTFFDKIKLILNNIKSKLWKFNSINIYEI